MRKLEIVQWLVILAGLHFSVCVSYRIESDRIIARKDSQAARQADAKYNLVRNLFLVSYLPTYLPTYRTIQVWSKAAICEQNNFFLFEWNFIRMEKSYLIQKL